MVNLHLSDVDIADCLKVAVKGFSESDLYLLVDLLRAAIVQVHHLFEVTSQLFKDLPPPQRVQVIDGVFPVICQLTQVLLQRLPTTDTKQR